MLEGWLLFLQYKQKLKAENMLRTKNNESPAYGTQQFNDMAEQLRSLAYAHNDQL